MKKQFTRTAQSAKASSGRQKNFNFNISEKLKNLEAFHNVADDSNYAIVSSSKET
jgi:hypothetical protein